MPKPKLRNSKKSRAVEIRPLGEFPKQIIYDICKWMVYYFAVGKSDKTLKEIGFDESWVTILAHAVSCQDRFQKELDR